MSPMRAARSSVRDLPERSSSARGCVGVVVRCVEERPGLWVVASEVTV